MDFPGIVRPWMRGLKTKIALSTAVLAQHMLLTDDKGNLYVGDGVTTIQSLKRLLRTGELVASVADFGAVGDGVTDDTAAIQAAVTWACANGAWLWFPAKTYLISSPIQMGNNSAGSNLWRITGPGATIQQATDNTQIFHFTKALTYDWVIEGLKFAWSNNQTSSQTSSIAIYFDGDASNNGFYNWVIRHCYFLNGYRGIASNDGSAFTNAVWGCRIEHCHYTSAMTGGFIRFIQTAAGQPNVSFSHLYMRGDSSTDILINIQGIDTFGLHNIETNNSVTQEVLLTTCKNVVISNVRSEGGTLLVNNGLWTFSDTVVTIDGFLVTSKTPNTLNQYYLIRGIGANTHIRVGDINVGSSFTYSNGAVVSLVQAGGIADIQFFGAYLDLSSGSVINKVYPFDTTRASVSMGKGIYGAIRTVTANATLGVNDDIVLCNGSGITITVPAASAVATGPNRQYLIKNIGTSSVTVSPATGTIDGASSLTLNPLGNQVSSVRLMSDGSSNAWYTVGPTSTDFSATNTKVSKVLSANPAGATATSAVVGAGAGTGATVSFQSGSNDTAGVVIVNAGTATAPGDIVTVTFGTAYPNAPMAVLISPEDGRWYSAQPYVDPTSLATTSFKVKANGTPTVSGQIRIQYFVVGV